MAAEEKNEGNVESMNAEVRPKSKRIILCRKYLTSRDQSINQALYSTHLSAKIMKVAAQHIDRFPASTLQKGNERKNNIDD